MNKPWATITSNETIKKTAENLKENGITPLVVQNGKEALEKIISIIPESASVMNGASVTLKEIGYMDYLASGQHKWNDLHKTVTAEDDPVKRSELRKKGVFSDYYLGSVNALTETGEFINASNTASQLPHISFTSPNLILVVGAQKIVATLNEALKRLEEYVVPLENKRMQKEYGMGTMLSKILITKKENVNMGRKIRVIIVKEALGL